MILDSIKIYFPRGDATLLLIQIKWPNCHMDPNLIRNYEQNSPRLKWKNKGQKNDYARKELFYENEN